MTWLYLGWGELLCPQETCFSLLQGWAPGKGGGGAWGRAGSRAGTVGKGSGSQLCGVPVTRALLQVTVWRPVLRLHCTLPTPRGLSVCQGPKCKD